MNVNDRAHVTGPQALLGDVLGQNNAVMFLNHGLASKGNAVISDTGPAVHGVPREPPQKSLSRTLVKLWASRPQTRSDRSSIRLGCPSATPSRLPRGVGREASESFAELALACATEGTLRTPFPTSLVNSDARKPVGFRSRGGGDARYEHSLG